MKTGISLFKSKVAKRIFILFLISAILPITVFSYLSFTQVSAQLREQSLTRFQNSAKSHGLVLVDRFSLLESELELYGSAALFSAEKNNSYGRDDLLHDRVQDHFNAISFIARSGGMFHLSGEMDSLPNNLMQILANDSMTKTLFHFEPGGGNFARIFLAKPASAPDGRSGHIVGDINAVYLWGIGYENILPPLTDSCILDNIRNTLFTSFELPQEVLHQISFESDSLESRSLEYVASEEGYFISYWPMFLQSKFEGPNLIVVLRNQHGDVFKPLSNYKKLFPLVTLLALWVVLLLSAISIRKSMVPLVKLKEGAIRLSRREFDTRVDVTSGDEFEALAETFNSSAASLGRQFSAMETMADIDKAVHASLHTKTIVKTALKRMFSFFSCYAIGFGLMEVRKPDNMRIFTCDDPTCDNLLEEFLEITPEDVSHLNKKFDYFFLDVKDKIPSFIPRQITQAIKDFLVLPVFRNKMINGIIFLGHKDRYSYSDDDLAHAQRISHQVSAALSNAYLVEELELLNWGTLEALARTVDTKSRWTAGHSERVAEMAVKIARVMGCDGKMVDDVHRAGFLHDIGKIGISLQILDKPDKLSKEEYEEVKQHPAIGAKIIEPIEAYEDAIPIILHHHERYDGKGYPIGLSGEDIPLGARILAVADVYDALISSRPYRQGWVEENVVQMITEEKGRHFDSKVVDAFLSAVSWSVEDVISEAGPH